MPDFAESITVAASASAVYGLVSDLPQMPTWSPECTRVTWSSAVPAGGRPVVGARFVGHNRAGAVRWFTQGEVTEATPGSLFSFRIHFGPVPIALWSYSIAPASGGRSEGGSGGSSEGGSEGGSEDRSEGCSGGCEVTESWTDLRPVALRRTFGLIFGDRHQRNRHGIHTTLLRLKSTAEAAVR